MQFGRIGVLPALLLLAASSLSQVTTIGRNGKVRISSLSKTQRAVLLPALEAATGEHRSNLLDDFEVFPEPLGSKGASAIFAISAGYGCGEHNNCPFLIFREGHDRDEPILSSVAGDYDILGSRHLGYRDISLTNFHGVTTLTSHWEYDGQEYRIQSCTERTTDGRRSALPASNCRF
jgi:hypothetical protein